MHVCSVAESQAQGYCVRELQVWRPDQVSLEGNGTREARVKVGRESPGLCWALGGPVLGEPPTWLHPTSLTLLASVSLQPSGHSPGLGLLGCVHR